MKVLEVKNVSKSFGGFKVLKDVNLTIEKGERRAVIGPNGAGKTTLFNIISGTLKPDKGRIFFYGKDISNYAPYMRARLGIARTFQRNNLFFNLSLTDNLKLAVQRVKTLYTLKELLSIAGLEDKQKIKVNELSYGEQRQVEILLALAQTPDLILLDEPTAGMSPAEADAVARMLDYLPKDITVLMVEHDMKVVFSVAKRVTVLHLGQVICDGTREEVRNSAAVKKAYLGEDYYGGEE